MLSRVIFALCFSLLMAFYGLKKKAVSKDGAVGGFIVGIFSCLFGGYRGGFVLLMFFVSSSKLTRFREMIKKTVEHGHKKGGQRNVVQVFANAFVGCVCATLFAVSSMETSRFNNEGYFSWNLIEYQELPISYDLFWPSFFLVGYLAHYACCNGDTWASELGVASGSQNPLLLLGIKENGKLILFSRVPRGTNGGISLVGTIASIAGGLFIGISFAFIDILLTFQFSLEQLLIPIIYGTFAGFIGSMIDSLLGGTLQYSYKDSTGKIIEEKQNNKNLIHITGIGILDNHQVNFLSSVLTSTLCCSLFYLLSL